MVKTNVRSIDFTAIHSGIIFKNGLEFYLNVGWKVPMFRSPNDFT